ncbi:hypothetical protein GW17_00018445 [Ensete ventricosum]|nr:hypothetical protein GW17_00018445 [Ensete ventricosum]
MPCLGESGGGASRPPRLGQRWGSGFPTSLPQAKVEVRLPDHHALPDLLTSSKGGCRVFRPLHIEWSWRLGFLTSMPQVRAEARIELLDLFASSEASKRSLFTVALKIANHMWDSIAVEMGWFIRCEHQLLHALPQPDAHPVRRLPHLQRVLPDHQPIGLPVRSLRLRRPPPLRSRPTLLASPL